MSMARIPTSLRSISSTQPSRASSIRFLSGRRPAPVRCSTHSQSHTERVKAWALLWPGATPASGTLAGWRTVGRRTDGSTMRIYMFVEIFSRVSVVSSAWARRGGCHICWIDRWLRDSGTARERLRDTDTTNGSRRLLFLPSF